MMDPEADLSTRQHLPSRSIYQLSTSAFTPSHSPANSPSHHIFPTSAFLLPSPSSSKLLPSLPVTTQSTAFAFPPHNSILPSCPLSPTLPLYDDPPSSSSSSITTGYSRPSSPLPLPAGDPYIASILSSPTDYSFSSGGGLSDDLSEALSVSDVYDIGCVGTSVFSPSSPAWSNEFGGEVLSSGEFESASASGSSDSEGRGGEGAGSSDMSVSIAACDQDTCQPTTDDDDTTSAATPTSPLPSPEPTKRRRKPSAKQQHNTTAPATTTTKPEKGRKRRLTASSPAPSQYDNPAADEAEELPEDKRERNKQSASDYRKRRKLYVATLEQQVSELKAALRSEREEGKKLRGENTVLRASMQMMREFVHGGKPTSQRLEEKKLKMEMDSEEEEDEREDEERAEAIKRWETAVSVRVPEEYRPLAPSKQAEDQLEEGVTHTHNTRKRRGRPAASHGAAGKQHKVGLTLFVLFSCFLLYFPWLTELSSPLVHAPSADVLSGGGEAVAGETASLFYTAPPDCAVRPELCNRGRTILKVMDSDVSTFLADQHYYTAPDVLTADDVSVAVKVESVKVEALTAEDELSVGQLAVGMSPLSLPVSAHNASAALAWLSEYADESIETLMLDAATTGSVGAGVEFESGGWAAVMGDGGSMQQAV